MICGARQLLCIEKQIKPPPAFNGGRWFVYQVNGVKTGVSGNSPVLCAHS